MAFGVVHEYVCICTYVREEEEVMMIVKWFFFLQCVKRNSSDYQQQLLLGAKTYFIPCCFSLVRATIMVWLAS